MDHERAEDLLLSLPRALKLLRESRGLGQDDLDRLTEKRGEKVGRASIARYEGGKRTPSLESLRRLLGALDVTWDELGRALAAARRGDSEGFVGMSDAPRVSILRPDPQAPSMRLMIELGEVTPDGVADVVRKVLDKDGGKPGRRVAHRGEEEDQPAE